MDSDEVAAHIKMAYAIVEDADIQGEPLRLAAFTFALAELGNISDTSKINGQDITDQAIPKDGEAEKSNMPAGSPAYNAYSSIAAALDVPLEVVELFYDIQGNVLALNIPTKVLARSSSAAMREIAIVMTVGLKYAGIAESTPFDVIRSVCDGHGKLDKKNFAAIMGGMKPNLMVVGKGSERALVAKKPADALAREILVRYSQVI